jgi:pimeloyl-ACP methyl ester carboxylesterase
VESGVRLEVLDWGGTGRAVVLLAGSGNTGHVYDDLAPSLTLAYVNRWYKTLLAAPGGVRLVDIPGADHYAFISNEEDVLNELRAFLKRLH